MLKCLSQCFARLWFWKSVSSKTAVDPSSRFCEFETLLKHRSCTKHWFKNLKILAQNFFFHFLEELRTSEFAFAIYWPLNSFKFSLNSVCQNCVLSIKNNNSYFVVCNSDFIFLSGFTFWYILEFFGLFLLSCDRTYCKQASLSKLS